MASPDFEALRARHPRQLVAALERRAAPGGRVVVTAGELASEANGTKEEALDLLRDQALAGWLAETVELRCPDCEEVLTPEEAAGEVCPYDTEIAFAEHGGVVETRTFVHDAPRSRDVAWALALHGMNTRGAWQEDFNWLFARSYEGGYMVPVAIYKYGLIRPGVLARWRQRQLIRGLIERMKRLSGEASGSGFGGRPDVIAHSFGTWLLGHALMSDPELRVGRVVLLGCILRPDFDWQRLIDRGQVEAVLNHYGTADSWASVSQRFIPCSGPAGRRGFDQEAVYNVPANGFKHSQFFAESEMPGLFRELWRHFLTWPGERLAELPGLSRPEAAWQPARVRFYVGRSRCTLEPESSCRLA